MKKNNSRRIQTLLGMYPDLQRELSSDARYILVDALGNQRVLQLLIDREVSFCKFQNGECISKIIAEAIR